MSFEDRCIDLLIWTHFGSPHKCGLHIFKRMKLAAIQKIRHNPTSKILLKTLKMWTLGTPLRMVKFFHLRTVLRGRVHCRITTKRQKTPDVTWMWVVLSRFLAVKIYSVVWVGSCQSILGSKCFSSILAAWSTYFCRLASTHSIGDSGSCVEVQNINFPISCFE